jgi:formylglycine-generating enzyme required for sulfatase activity
MGSNEAPEERPVVTIHIAKPFGVSVYEVLQADYRVFCQATDRTFPVQPTGGDDLPIVNVSWNDARAYTAWLTSVTGSHYRLPTEAEWEYAARAKQKGLYPQGDQLSPTDAHYTTAARPAGLAARTERFNRNGFRLYHTIGNAREWVQDRWSASHEGTPTDGSARDPGGDGGTRVVRGGAFTDTAAKLRLSTREQMDADAHDAVTGFRVVREVQ